VHKLCKVKLMKIGNTGSVKSAGTKKTKKKSSGGGAAFADHLSDSDSTTSAGFVSGPAAMDALLAAQEVPDSTEEEKRQQAAQQGKELLDQLEEIRLGLLMGGIPLPKLERLQALVQTQKKNIQDPDLKELLMDIELRAKVELAKYQNRS